MSNIEGLIVAPFTPMNSDGSINVQAVSDLYETYKSNGVTGAFINGSTGEGMGLTTPERKQLTEAWNEVVSEDFRLLVHVGSSALEEARQLARHAAGCSNVSGISVVGPFYRKPDTVGSLVKFCGKVAAEAPDTPFYYYHIPALTGVDLPMNDFLQKAADQIPTFAGIKFSHHDLVDYSRCQETGGEQYDLMFGNDELLSCGLMLGARGFVGSTYNLFPELYHQIIRAFSQGDFTRVKSLQQKSVSYVSIIAEYGYASAAKRLMKYLGVDCGPARLPLETPSEQQMDELEGRLRREGFFDFAVQPV